MANLKSMVKRVKKVIQEILLRPSCQSGNFYAVRVRRGHWCLQRPPKAMLDHGREAALCKARHGNAGLKAV